MIDVFLEGLNYVFGNKFVRMFIAILTSIWAGYILQPVPAWLNNVFNTSHAFKFVVLVFIGLAMSDPITLDSLATTLLTATAISVVFAFMRHYDKLDANTNKDKATEIGDKE